MRLKAYAAQTQQGSYLQVNEDGYEFDFENNVYLILDGFGGSGIGDRAVEKIKQEVKSYFSQLSHDPNATMPLYFNPRNLLEGNAILNALMNSHQNLLKLNQERNLNQKAGASLVAAVKADSILVLVGVGNCCAYHFRQGRLTKIIVEDNLKFLSKDQFNNKFHSAPANALGMYPEMGHTLKEVRLNEGDKVLMLTDGVFSDLNEDEILYAMNRSAMDAQERINDLLKLSSSRGNTDNQTAMLLEF
ncbi:MAG: PP2C family serine/threonine-protein phosphatase [Bacteriovoracaceae bacterium]